MKKSGTKVFNVLAILFLAIISWITLNEFYIKPKKLEKEEVRYTYATIIGFTNPSNGGKVADYMYKVNDKQYSGFFGVSNWDPKIGDKYLLKFVKSNPGINRILLNKKVTISSTNVPEEGWEQIPSY